MSLNIQNANTDLAEAVLQQTVELAKQNFKSKLIACYALGSLAHGGFSTLVSDVDMAVILEDPIDTNYSQTIDSIKESVKNSALPLADRLSIFWGTPHSLENKGESGRFPPLDKLDLIENGRLLVGKDIRNTLSKPTELELVTMGTKFALQILATPEVQKEIAQPSLLYSKGVRQLTKIILFPVRLLYSSMTGKIGHNEEAVKYYLANNSGDKAKLVAAAFNWRSQAPENEGEAITLMSKVLIELYVQFINAYHAKMLEYKETILAEQLMQWRETLLNRQS